MEVEQVAASDETAMRERLMEKVLARNGPKKEESTEIEIMDTDKEKYCFSLNKFCEIVSDI